MRYPQMTLKFPKDADLEATKGEFINLVKELKVDASVPTDLVTLQRINANSGRDGRQRGHEAAWEPSIPTSEKHTQPSREHFSDRLQEASRCRWCPCTAVGRHTTDGIAHSVRRIRIGRRA